MHDEAATHFVSMIGAAAAAARVPLCANVRARVAHCAEQTTVGHRYIKDQFGAVPTVGWQVCVRVQHEVVLKT